MSADKVVKKAVERIKSLKVQGASNVRKTVLKAIRESVQESKAKTADAFRNELKRNIWKLVTARPTEPETRTAMRVVLHTTQAQKTYQELKNSVVRKIDDYEQNREQAMKKIAKVGSALIRKESTVFTHCHSSTVEEIISEAHRQKKIKAVVCTETRPRFQGRITASNLAKKGIPVRLVVDSSAMNHLRDCDYFFTGADAVLADGDVVNKIGTRMISLAAQKMETPHYVATSSYGFDPLTYYGVEEKIEQRPSEEVWDKKIKNVKVENPAFDITEREYIEGIVCEFGVFTPQMFSMLMFKRLHLDRRDYTSLIEMLKE